MKRLHGLRDSALLKRQAELSLLQRWTWWEGRRLAFNALVGITGLAGCALLFLTSAFIEFVLKMETVLPDPPLFALFGIIAYGVAANLGYSLGFLAEWMVLKVWDKETATRFAEISLFLGFTFSVVLTAGIPTILSALGLGIRLIEKLTH